MKVLYVSKNFSRCEADLGKDNPAELVLMVDLDRCISCGACELACQVEHAANICEPAPYRPIAVRFGKSRTVQPLLRMPLSCRHCDSPCEYYSQYNFWTICPIGREHNAGKASCDACVSRLERGFMPACATRCTMKCIYFGQAKDVAFTLNEKRLREMGDIEITA
jgi:Fe-S-cluster-containing dehydrogenase component